MNDLSHWGPGFVGFTKWTQHTHFNSFSGSGNSALPGGGGMEGESQLIEYGLPDFQEAKAVSICLGTWG